MKSSIFINRSIHFFKKMVYLDYEMVERKTPTTKKIRKPRVPRKKRAKKSFVGPINQESHRTLFAALFVIVILGIIYFNGQTRPSDVYRAQYSTPKVEAKAVFAYDIPDQKILIQKNSSLQYPLASLTKIMTSIIALEKLKTDETIIISREAFDQPEDQGLFVGEEWGRDELIQFMFLESSNDAAYALAEKIGGVEETVILMNLRSEELGLHIRFTNVTGLDTPESIGAMGSAEDIARLLAYAYHTYPLIWDVTTKNTSTLYSLSGFVHEAENTNYNSELTFTRASKTGFTDRAGGNLAIIYDIGLEHPVVAVVLGSTLEGRFLDMKNVISLVSSPD